MEKSSERTRMNVGITAKGHAQWDVTVEYPTPQEAERNLGEAIDRVRAVIKEKGLAEAGAA